jgi:SAM-dependent methyltransferase
MIEYPWIVANAGDVAGRRVLDIGAGVCPVPLWLSAHGAVVTTVDGHPNKRTTENWAEWNEWGFLDYSTIDSTIVSFNTLFPDIPGDNTFDMVYSVSVIEHVPGRLRRDIFTHTSQLLKPGGQLLLTLDLIPETNNLWNLSEGQIVEEAEHHGTLEDVRHELEHCGFGLEAVEVEKRIPHSRTDIACIKARKVAAPHRHWPQNGLLAKLKRLMLGRADRR